jgi:CRISPR-associated protein Csm3
MTRNLVGFKEITGKIVCLTGTTIGGSGGVVEIGGVDNPMIKDPITKLPYIPGSSLKGKMRSLLELELGKVRDDGEPHSCDAPECPICLLFGTGAKERKAEQGPSRLIFRDCFLTEEGKRKLEELRKDEGFGLEIKTEVNINRWTGKPLSGPRQVERIPADTSFNFSIVVRNFTGDEELKIQDKSLEDYIKIGLLLLEKDAIGGSGSRGYGQVRFENLKLDGKEFSLEDT